MWLLEPQLPRAPSLSTTVIKWPGLEKRYEAPESAVSSRWIITLLLAPLGLVLSPSTPASQMKLASGEQRGEAAWQAAAGVGETLSPHYAPIQHPLRPQPPPSRGVHRGREKEELGGLAIPEGSHTVHSSQKPKKQQT